MVDIHSHIIAEIDDGSKSIQESLLMLKRASEDGCKEIVATPHYRRDYCEVSHRRVRKLVNELNLLAKLQGIDININYGQEVYYSKYMIEDYKDKFIGTINDSKYMLVELPRREDFDEEIFKVLYELKEMGLRVIIAHPERYRAVIDAPIVLNKFIEQDILFQMDSGSLEGKFGKEVQKTAEILLKNGIYNFIGSDAHNNQDRCTGISKVIKSAGRINKIYKNLFEISGVQLLNDELVEFKGRKIAEKKKFFFF